MILHGKDCPIQEIVLFYLCDDNAMKQWRGQRHETMARTTPKNNCKTSQRRNDEDNAGNNGEDEAREQ